VYNLKTKFVAWNTRELFRGYGYSISVIRTIFISCGDDESNVNSEAESGTIGEIVTPGADA